MVVTASTAGPGAPVATRRSAKPEEIVRLATLGRKIDDLLGREWLLTNARGSYASSTVVGCHTSGYHGLLIGSPDPLVRRLLTLSNCLETILSNGAALALSTFEFSDRFSPQGYPHQEEFRRDTGVHFVYHTEPVDLCKSIYLACDSDTVVVEYTFTAVRHPVDFVIRPFVGMRDFHTLQRGDAPLVCRVADKSVLIQNSSVNDCELRLDCPTLNYVNDPQWWYAFVYRASKARGVPHTEDLWAPGFFRGHLEGTGTVVFSARLDRPGDPQTPGQIDPEAIKENLAQHQRLVLERARARSRDHRLLCLAADQFVVKRRGTQGERTTIVAGYPWFADWGRDTLVSLPGLLLLTGRQEEARSALAAYAAAVDGGMVPNRFDERTGEAQFNSVDASLWFIHAAFEYLAATGDIDDFTQRLFPTIQTILQAYQAGTRFGIHADADGLITAGDLSTQLTWMDAQCDGVAVTPRCGKAVEINALWHNALVRVQKFCEQQRLAEAARYAGLATRVAESFCRCFWNNEVGYLNDTVRPDGTVDARCRPNQLFAVSLPFGPPLTRVQRWDILTAVEQRLLTPYGLRTLSGRDPAYQGRYEGSPRRRDEAYHQGTVWPYLLGPYLEAYLRVRNHSDEAKSDAAELLRPLLRHLTEDGCLGSIAEVFDGDPPHRPGGCGAQAWSVAELLRVYRLVTPA